METVESRLKEVEEFLEEGGMFFLFTETSWSDGEVSTSEIPIEAHTVPELIEFLQKEGVENPEKAILEAFEKGRSYLGTFNGITDEYLQCS
jgi:hypothetical protein